MFRLFKKKEYINEPSLSEMVDDINLDDIKAHIKAYPITIFGGGKSGNQLEIKTDNKARFVRFSLQTEVSFHLDTIEIYNKNGVNVAKNKKTLISSMYNDDPKYGGAGALVGKKNGGANFHTKRERRPWIVIDLGSIRNLDRIVIYNREGQFHTRALSLKVSTSKNLTTWNVVFENWASLKNYKDGHANAAEQAMLYAAILESAPAQAFIKKLIKAGEHNKALEMHQTINELVADKGLALGPHGFTKTFELSSDAQNNKVYSELAQLLHWINDEFGVPAFISSGTLLGIVRDGKFIGHDDDVDICYVSNETTEQAILEERIRLTEFIKSKGCRVAPSGIAHYWCTTPKGVNLDIFTGFLEDGFCSMNPIGRREVKQEDVLPLTKQETNGVVLHLPRNPEPLLVLNYGQNWRVPDPLWTFNWGKAKEDFKFLYF